MENETNRDHDNSGARGTNSTEGGAMGDKATHKKSGAMGAEQEESGDSSGNKASHSSERDGLSGGESRWTSDVNEES